MLILSAWKFPLDRWTRMDYAKELAMLHMLQSLLWYVIMHGSVEV